MSDILSNRLVGNELKYVQEVLDAEFCSSSGSVMGQRFEENFSSRFGSSYGISFTNGTATMHAALEAMGIGPGDEVIVPPLTMSATTFAVLQANATPVFADVDPYTFQIDANSIRDRLTPNTKAIITVALYGLSPDMYPILELAKNCGVKVIEDNAQCFLGTYKGNLVGTLGDCASYSFQSTKHLTSGEGGIIITNDMQLAENIRKVQSLGYAGVSAAKGKITKLDIQDPDYSRHVTMGWNYRMPELCCAVALAQTEKIDFHVQHRMSVGKIFQEVANGFGDWFLPQYVPDGYTHSYWTWVVLLDIDKVGWHEFRDQFIKFGGDGVYAAWKLSYLEPMFENMSLLGREKFISNQNIELYQLGSCPVAEKIQPRLLQFRTNYWDIEEAYNQGEALHKTLDFFATLKGL